jgi:hypothetical protein
VILRFRVQDLGFRVGMQVRKKELIVIKLFGETLSNRESNVHRRTSDQMLCCDEAMRPFL